MPKPIKLHIVNIHSSLCIKYLNKAAKKKTLSFKCLYLNIASGSVMPNSLNPLDYIPSGSSVHGILQARIQEWVAIPFSNGCSLPRDGTQVSCITGIFFTI